MSTLRINEKIKKMILRQLARSKTSSPDKLLQTRPVRENEAALMEDRVTKKLQVKTCILIL